MNVRLDVNGGIPFAVSFKGLSLRPDQELLEVPRDVGPVDGAPDEESGVLHEAAGLVVGVGQFVFQIGKDRVRVCSVDVTLLKDGEVGLEPIAWTDVLQGLQDLTVGAVLLRQNTSFISLVPDSPSLILSCIPNKTD